MPEYPFLYAGARLFQGIRNRTIPNFSMIAERDITQMDNGGQGGEGRQDGINDGLWCQSSDSNSITWLAPNGQAIAQQNNLGANSLYTMRSQSQVGLQRHKTLMQTEWGLYTCRIMVQSKSNTLLVVWIGGDSVYDGASGQCR